MSLDCVKLLIIQEMDDLGNCSSIHLSHGATCRKANYPFSLQREKRWSASICCPIIAQLWKGSLESSHCGHSIGPPDEKMKELGSGGDWMYSVGHPGSEMEILAEGGEPVVKVTLWVSLLHLRYTQRACRTGMPSPSS